jgi:L-alanine-DL-glutamate epimerase-like enolase superfamily enzyme
LRRLSFPGVPFIKDSHIQLSDAPGLGIALNEDHVRANLVPGEQWWGS